MVALGRLNSAAELIKSLGAPIEQQDFEEKRDAK
jgi:hypothetical protein